MADVHLHDLRTAGEEKKYFMMKAGGNSPAKRSNTYNRQVVTSGNLLIVGNPKGDYIMRVINKVPCSLSPSIQVIVTRSESGKTLYLHQSYRPTALTCFLQQTWDTKRSLKKRVLELAIAQMDPTEQIGGFAHQVKEFGLTHSMGEYIVHLEEAIWYNKEALEVCKL